MGIDIYWTGLLVLIPIVAVVAGKDKISTLLRRRRSSRATVTPGDEKQHVDPDPDLIDDDARQFQKVFLRVYLLVVGSEWLQSPFLYPLLRDEKSLSEETIATLYITTYAAAAVSAPFTGYLADRFGRRNACLAFCIVHSIAALSVCFDTLSVLVAGRCLAGVGLSLLWTVFESWMVAEYNNIGSSSSSGGGKVSLEVLFSVMTTAKCVTAIFAGVLGHCVVLALGSKIHPFLLGVTLNITAAILMIRTWNENYGTNSSNNNKNELPLDDEKTPPRTWDLQIWAMSFISSSYEGTIFLFMFFWPSTLQSAHDPDPTSESIIPHGVIFASFMAIMVLGALSFNKLTATATASPTTTQENQSIATKLTTTPTQLLKLSLLLSAASFALASTTPNEKTLYIAFLVLEACNGVYVPSVAWQRGTMVSDGARARIYGLMNVPLFVFVVVALRMADGASSHQSVFLFCAALLLVSALVTSLYIDKTKDEEYKFSRFPVDELDASQRQGEPIQEWI
ncbi:MFS general substrate transporter [Poronia punctata]|nr:MFS general substrate transporter [Poronia punctata]